VLLDASEGTTLRPPAPSDLELMRRAKLGEVDAFAAIYDRHAATVLALGKRILASVGDAQDVLHDVFLEAWQSVRDYDPQRASVRTWLLVRMRSRALDRLGRRALEQRVQHNLPPTAAAFDADATHPDRRFALKQALERLDAALRSSLELIYFCGFTAAEVAQHMNVPEGTVRSRVARGLLALERALTESQGVNPHVEG
jgi:RNA polymerase sigma-70 factor (ECF subfamily)